MHTRMCTNEILEGEVKEGAKPKAPERLLVHPTRTRVVTLLFKSYLPYKTESNNIKSLPVLHVCGVCAFCVS